MPDFNIRHRTVFCTGLTLLISIVFYISIIVLILYLVDALPPFVAAIPWYSFPATLLVLSIFDSFMCQYSIWLDPRYLFDVMEDFKLFMRSLLPSSNRKNLTNGGRKLRMY
jgi:hypothetical protein